MGRNMNHVELFTGQHHGKIVGFAEMGENFRMTGEVFSAGV